MNKLIKDLKIYFHGKIRVFNRNEPARRRSRMRITISQHRLFSERPAEMGKNTGRSEDFARCYGRALDDLKRERFESAVFYLQKVIRIDPQFDPAYFNLGRAYYRLGEFSLALGNLNKAIGLNPRGQYYAERILLYRRCGLNKLALFEKERLNESTCGLPDDPDVFSVLTG